MAPRRMIPNMRSATNPLVTVANAPQMRRTTRSPKHSWHVNHRPYVIQPICLAPVLAGETMKSALWQARVVSDPVKNKLAGAHIEYMWFYVKLTDMIQVMATYVVADEIKKLLLDPDATVANIDETSASLPYYFAGNGVNWSKLCLQRVVEEYFRDEDDAWDAATVDGLPLAYMSSETWLNSIMREQDYVQEDVTLVDEAGTGTLTASELETAMARWEVEKMLGWTQMSWEDYLAAQGVRQSVAVQHKPELLRWARDWTYPANTVATNTADAGEVSSAWSWSVAERIDKDRFFPEPGFIFAVTICRPKAYYARQSGSAAWHMSNAFSWMPQLLRDDPRYRILPFAEGAGPLSALSMDGTGGYWLDVGDLLTHGDQFVNFSMTASDDNKFALPTNSLGKKFVSEVDIEGLFTDDATDGTLNQVRQDGVASFNIASSLRDISSRT